MQLSYIERIVLEYLKRHYPSPVLPMDVYDDINIALGETLLGDSMYTPYIRAALCNLLDSKLCEKVDGCYRYVCQVPNRVYHDWR